MLKNTSGQHISFIAIATADGSAVTSGTPVVHLSKDGGAQATSTNTASHLGNGVWVLDLTQAETNADNLSAVMVLTNAVNSFAQAFPYVLADFKANVTGLSTFDPAADAVANVTLVGTCTANTDMRGTDNASTFDPAADAVANVTLVATCTTNTDMRGTDNANTTAPDNAGITANGTAIAALNDFNPASDTVAQVTLVATCTTNTDMRGTDNANTVAPANSDIAAIKTKTDQLTFTLANKVDSNALAGNFMTDASSITNFGIIQTLIGTVGNDVLGLNDFDPAADTVANVTNVSSTAVCVSNSDMRGTDGANTVAPDNAGIASNGTALATTTKTGVAYTATAQSGDTIQVTLS